MEKKANMPNMFVGASYAEATAMAENLAADSMINISYIEVYLFQ